MATKATNAVPDTDDKCNDSQRQHAEDSDEDLYDVSFPIIDTRSTAGGHSSATDSGEINNNHAVGESVTSSNGVDEDAILRCFALSVNAHVEGGVVEAFEPMPPKNDDGVTSVKVKDDAGETDPSAENIPERQKKTDSGKSEWFPASLPLPSWAKNIP